MFRIVEHDRMNLLGLMLGDVLLKNLSRPSGSSLASKLSGAIGVTAGKMSITIQFTGTDVILKRGLDSTCTSKVRGSLSSLLQVSLGMSPIALFLTGKISFSGSPFFLFRILPLMRSPLENVPQEDVPQKTA